MASLSRDKDSKGKYNGCRTLQYLDSEGNRKGIRLGKVTAKTAEVIKTKVESLGVKDDDNIWYIDIGFDDDFQVKVDPVSGWAIR